MSGIKANIVCHCLTLDVTTKLIILKKQKIGEEKMIVIDEEVKKMMEARFISKIKFLTWS